MGKGLRLDGPEQAILDEQGQCIRYRPPHPISEDSVYVVSIICCSADTGHSLQKDRESEHKNNSTYLSAVKPLCF